MTNKIEVNSWVVIRREKHMKLLQVKPRHKEYIGKAQFTFEGAIGKTFGTSFEIIKGKLVKAEPAKILESVAGPTEESESVEESNDGEGKEGKNNGQEKEAKNNGQEKEAKNNGEEKEAKNNGEEKEGKIDNRNLLDRDENQKLCRDDIEEMRARGARGEEIIGELVNNSLTFKGKTEYSREKYVNRKKKKHFSLLTILQPSTRIMCDMYYAKGRDKLCGLRLDSLTQLLLHANVRAHSKLMVVESSLGLVLGAVMERMGGLGTLIHFYGGSTPQRPAYLGFNFPEAFSENFFEYPLCRVAELHGEEEVKTTEAGEGGKTTTTEADPEKPETEEKEKDSSEEPPRKKFKSDAEMEKIKMKKKMRLEEQNNAKRLVMQKDFDGLIVCSKYHPTPIVMKLIDFVAPSRPLVIFNQFREPIIDVYNQLKNSGRVVNLKLTESWLREYQVLPGRTHPMMQMSGGGGFLLTGFVVEL